MASGHLFCEHWSGCHMPVMQTTIGTTCPLRQATRANDWGRRVSTIEAVFVPGSQELLVSQIQHALILHTTSALVRCIHCERYLCKSHVTPAGEGNQVHPMLQCFEQCEGTKEIFPPPSSPTETMLHCRRCTSILPRTAFCQLCAQAGYEQTRLFGFHENPPTDSNPESMSPTL